MPLTLPRQREAVWLPESAERDLSEHPVRSSEEPALCLWMSGGIGSDVFSG